MPGDLGGRSRKCSDFQQVAILGGGTEYVTPGLTGQYSDELIIGTEYEVLPDVKVGVNYMHRTLPVVIEDILIAAPATTTSRTRRQNFDEQAATLATQGGDGADVDATRRSRRRAISMRRARRRCRASSCSTSRRVTTTRSRSSHAASDEELADPRVVHVLEGAG